MVTGSDLIAESIICGNARKVNGDCPGRGVNLRMDVRDDQHCHTIDTFVP